MTPEERTSFEHRPKVFGLFAVPINSNGDTEATERCFRSNRGAFATLLPGYRHD